MKIKYNYWVIIFFLINAFTLASNPYNKLRFDHHKFISSIAITDKFGISQNIESEYLNKDSTYYYELNYFGILSNNTPDFRSGFKIYGNDGKSIFVFEPIITVDKYGEYVLGTNYVRSKLSGRFENGFIRLYNKNISIQFGRSSTRWGQSFTSSIIQSGLSPSSENILLQLNQKKAKFEILTSQLGSDEKNDGTRIKRYLAGHKVSWKPNNKLLFGVGEQLLYTGVNRTIEMNYLNPIVPYVFYALEGEEEKVEFSDNDNLIMFSYGRYKIKPNLSLYFEFIVDEYQIDETNDDNALGYKIGFDGRNQKFYSTTWFIEWTKIDQLTYTHPGQYTSWQNHGHSIGFPYGPDSECFQIQSMSDLNNGLLLFCDFIYLEKGRNNLLVESDGIINVDRPNNKYMFYNFSVIKEYRSFNIEAGWSHMPFPNAIAKNNSLFPSNGSAFIMMSLSLDNNFSFSTLD